jgi:phage-related protein
METMEERKPKPVVWMGSSKEDLKEFPDDVQGEFGHALWVAQEGDKYVSAKPLKGFGGASVLEIVEDYDGDTYRAVYTVRFAEAVFVLHCYQKKSRRGAETPKSDVELIKRRLKAAEELYEEMKRGGVL